MDEYFNKADEDMVIAADFRQYDELSVGGNGERERKSNADLDELLSKLEKEHDEASAEEIALEPDKTVKTAIAAKLDASKTRTITSFPVADTDSLSPLPDPISMLEELLKELLSHGDYQRVRDKYCQLSIILNLQGRIAPAFRPQLNTGKKKGDSIFIDIHRDLVVIDAHWLHSKGLHIKARDAEFRPMFNAKKPFPFDLAWTFAIKKWKSLHRTDEALTLTTFQQCQLLRMRGKVVSQRFEAALRGVKTSTGRIPAKIAAVRQSLNTWGEKDRRVIPFLDGYENLWLAEELLESDAPIRQIAELAALMDGSSQLADKTIRDKRKKLLGQIKGASSPRVVGALEGTSPGTSS